MKKIIISMGILSSMFLSAQAQNLKNVDIEVSIQNYVNNQEIPFGETVMGVLKIKNLGPDTLVSGDKIFLKESTSPFLTTFSTGLAPNDSAVFPIFSFVNGGGEADSNYTFCFWRTVAGDSTDVYLDANTLNDTSCVTIILKGSPTHLKEVKNEFKVNLFPNPLKGTNVLNMDLSAYSQPLEQVKVKVYDILGRVVAEQHIALTANKGQLEFNKTLPPGIYNIALFSDAVSS